MKLANVICAGLILTVAGCGKHGDEKAAHGGGGPGGFAVPVVGVKIEGRTVQDKVSVIGSMSANESVEVKSQIDGIVTEIRFEEGQHVSKGDEIIVLDRAKLDATLAQSKANLNIAETTFNRIKSLVDQGAVSKQEFDQANAELTGKKAQVDLIAAQVKDAVIAAPFDGIVGERLVSVGQVISKDKSLTFIVDDNPMKVDVHVPERYVSRLEKGQSVDLKVAAFPDTQFKGEVYFIDPRVDDATRTILVKAKVPNEDGQLREGMFAKLDLIVAEKQDSIVIPETALIPKGDDVFVFIVDAESKAKMSKVTTGIRLPGEVEITSGLNAGDVVITEGFQKIGPGSAVKVMPPEADNAAAQHAPAPAENAKIETPKKTPESETANADAAPDAEASENTESSKE